MKKQFQVVAGIIVFDDKVLCGKRGKGYFEGNWEFPGGKIEIGETKVEALARELKEEIDINIDTECCKFYQSVSIEFEEYVINLDTFIIKYNGDTLSLNVHQELKWVVTEDLLKYKWCDTDYQIVDYIVHNGGIKGLSLEFR